MNATTASNHLIGELNALYVMHHALGGKHLDERNRDNRTGEMMFMNELSLRLAYEGLRFFCPKAPAPPPIKSAYDIVKKYTRADVNSTIYQAKMNLKEQMLAAYVVHGIGAGLIYSKWPPAVIAGGIMVAGSMITQGLLAVEYKFLDVVESIAVGMKGIKKSIPGIITALHTYQKGVRTGIPVVIPLAAKRIKEAHGLESGFVVGGGAGSLVKRELPIVTLPIEWERPNLGTENKSQMIRATYPWVVHWRKNVQRLLRIGAFTSGAASFYKKYTDQYSLEASTWLRKSGNYRADLTVINRGRFSFGGGERGKKILLPVVKGLNDVPDGVSKGREKWNDWGKKRTSSVEIDRLFCHMAYAKRKSPKVATDSIFRQENPNGIVSFSQSMVYNANEKRQLKRSQQPRVTWDTLNWNGPVAEFKSNRGSALTPTIKLNWQAKLTPVTTNKLLQTGPATGIVDPEMFEVLWAAREGLAFFTNH